MSRHIAIVGAGFSGTMLAVGLLRRPGTKVTLIERGGEPGRGLAFGAADPIHLLNVRAGNMSALPEDPGHLVRWLEARGIADAPASFAQRLAFGDYVQQLFTDAAAQAPERLNVMRGRATAIMDGPTGVSVTIDGGDAVEADAAVLAMGNLPPKPPAMLAHANLPAERFFANPWVPGLADGLGPDDTALVVGTGLTMVDIVLLLERKGFTGPILALSRRGLIPRAHAAGPPAEPLQEVPEPIASKLVRQVRARAAQIGWRQAVDALRPITQQLWRNADPAVRRRFLRHLRPWWDVHRHRIAPEVHERIQAMIDSGQLQVAAGKITNVENEERGVAVSWRPRGSDSEERLTVARIINCTGPEADLRGTNDPLLKSLVEAGVIRPDPLGIGIDVDEGSRTIASYGQPSDRLYAVGPLTRGCYWEIIAVPDIRNQVSSLAKRLSGGE